MSVPTGKRKPFNGTTPVECNLSEANRNGVQIIAEGFNIEDADVTVTFRGGQTQVVTPPTTTGNKAVVIGEGFSLVKVSVGGVSAGAYHVTFIQL